MVNSTAMTGSFEGTKTMSDKEPFSAFTDFLIGEGQRLGQALHEWAKLFLGENSLPPETIRFWTYADLIQSVLGSAPPRAEFSFATVLREDRGDKWFVVQLYLDNAGRPLLKRNGLPYGKRLFVRSFNRELEDAFGDQNLIVIE
jgi:hypothetical protein